MRENRRPARGRDSTLIGAARQQDILALISRGEVVAVGGLTERLGVSQETIRRDIRALEEVGLLRRVHGGAAPAGTVDLVAPRPVTDRLDLDRAAKLAAARAALALFVPGMHVFLGGSSTMLLLAGELARAGQGLSVTTNMLDIAVALGEARNCEVTLLGGVLKPSTRTLIGPEVLRALERRVFDLAICGTSAIDETRGCLGPSDWHAALGAALAKQSQRCAVVADTGKFGRRDAHVVVPLSVLHALATDRPPPDGAAEALAGAGVTVLLPPAVATA
jgi:DeoR/GlpR family transcriptional regulator of sugar metabolism